MICVKCKWCGIPFLARSYERSRGWGRFCGRFCKGQWDSVVMTIGSGCRDRSNRKRRERRKDPELGKIDRSRDQVRAAIKRGDLIKRACEVCGKWPSEAHHEDYSQPLVVKWLCQKHHRLADIELGVRFM